jgi:iron complex transport system substrate-binding protein
MKFSRLSTIFFCIIILAGCGDNPKRGKNNLTIIALSPSIAETVFYLGKGPDIAGVSTFCNYPEEAKKIPQVANVSDINLEFAVKLKPDIVLLMPSQSGIAAKLSALNVKTFTVKQESLDDIINSFVTIGRETGAEARGRAVSDSLKAVLEEMKSPANGLKALISVGREYGSPVSYIYSTGKEGFLTDIINLLGYKNILDTQISYPKIGAETIMTLDPDVIIDLAPSEALSETDLLKDWEIFGSGKAWKNNRILIFRGDHTTIPGPRIFDFIRDLKKKGSEKRALDP